jgi:hypothetical protein
MKRDAGEVEDMDDDDEDLVHPFARCIIICLSYFIFYYYGGCEPVGTPGAWMHIHYNENNNNSANSNVLFYYNLYQNVCSVILLLQ